MLRGPLGSVALLRGMLNPLLRRTVSTAPVRYANGKGRKKSEGMFSWLREMLRPDPKPSEALTAVDQPEATAFDIDFPANVITFSSNFKHEDATDRDTSTAGTSEPRDPTASMLADRSNFCVNLTKLESKIDEHEYPSIIKDNFINNMSLGHRQRISLLRHDFLTLNSPFRTIVGCTPRNTKPPIREPNMPEKQEKKDDKKDKKQKKPVIRMEGGVEDGSKKDLMAEAKSNLHDNMDVNFRYQWGIRIPEEVGPEGCQKWSKGVKQPGDTYFVGDTNYSQYQPTYAYSMDAIETMKGMTLSMSTVGDKGKTETKTEEKKPGQVAAATAGKDEKATEESIKTILKTAAPVLKETTVLEEEFAAPTSIDAEISAWKELVQKSKVPVDATKEFNAQMGADSPRTAEMLTIRPEPPRPKLDIRAVRSVDELIKEDEEEEVTGDVKPKPVEVKRATTTTDVQKLDSKKMHTAALCYLKRNSDSSYDLRRKYRHPPSSWGVDSGDHANDAKHVAADFSTSTEGGYENVQQDVAKGVRQSEPETNPPSQDMERRNVPIESLAPQEIQPEPMVEQEFVDRLHPMPDREIEISLNQSTPESHQDMRECKMSSKKYEPEEHMSGHSEDYQGNFEYASPYEDDFYPGYESMSLEPAVSERSNLDKQSQQATARGEEQDDKEVYSKKVKEAEKISDYVTEGKYVRVPGDPYPYSKEHFNKWRLHHEDIRIGPISYLDKDPLINTPITDSSTGQRVDVQQPVRKMSYDSRSRPAQGVFVRQ